MDPAEIEIVEFQSWGLVYDFRWSTFSENSASHDQGIERIFAKIFRKEVESGASSVENRVYDAILTEMDKVVKPGNERLWDLSLRHQDADWRVWFWNPERRKQGKYSTHDGI